MKGTEHSVRLKWLALKIGSGKTPKGGAEAYVSEGVIFIRSQNVHFDGLKLDDAVFIDADTDSAMAATRVKPDDVLLNITGASLGRVTIAPHDLGPANVNQHVCIIRPSPRMVPRFLMWRLQSHSIQERIVELQVGGNRDGLSFQQVGQFEIPSPSIPCQRAIADYLDCETARIDALMVKKQRLIELLTDRTIAAAESILLLGAPEQYGRALNQGLQVVLPRGWKASACKRLFREVDERSTTGAETMLAVSKSVGVVPRDEWTDREPRADTLQGYKLVEPGDIVINRMRAFNGALGVSRWHGIVSPDYAVLRSIGDVEPRYYARLLRTPTFVDEMRRRLRGIGGIDMGNVRTPRINMADFGQIIVPVPPPHEQRELAARAEALTARSQQTAGALGKALELLAERRRAIITAVTGQIDVSKVAA